MALKPVTIAQVTIASGGTAQAIAATATPVTTILFQAAAGNTGNVFIGDSAVTSTRHMVSLAPGQFFAVSADRLTNLGEEFILSDFYIDGTTGDKVSPSYLVGRR